MKRFFLSLPLAVPLAWSLVGCASTISGTAETSNTANASSTSNTSNDANSGHVDNNVANNATDNSTSTANATSASNPASASKSTSASDAASGTASAKKTYRVVDEAQPSFPAPLVQALHKLAVPPPPASMKVPDKARVLFSTSKGDITVELNGKAAPLHVKSFLYLAQKGYFNGTTFHRFADLSGGVGQPARIIQGGDPLTKSTEYRALAGSGGPGYAIPREYNSLKHSAMVLAMARTGDPDSAGSQFYFTLDATPFLDKENSADGFGYTVFGKVIQGQSVVLNCARTMC